MTDDRELYQRWRAPRSAAALAIAAYAQRRRSDSILRPVLVAAALIAVVVLVARGPLSVPGSVTPAQAPVMAEATGPAGLTLAAVQLPARPDFDFRGGLTLPADRPAMPTLGSVSMTNLTLEEM